MRSKQYFTSIKNNPHEISTDPLNELEVYLILSVIPVIQRAHPHISFKIFSEKGHVSKVERV